MSLEAQLWAVDRHTGDVFAKFVLLILAGDADGVGLSTITRDRIGRLTEMTPGEIERAMTALRAGGFLTGGKRGDEEVRLLLW